MSAFADGRNVHLTYQGLFPTTGFSSGLTHIQNNSVLALSCKVTVDSVLKIFVSPSQDYTEKSNFFIKTLAANTVFHRRFACPHQYVAIDVENTGSVANGSLNLDVCDYRDIHFDASTFLNSNINKDTQTNLIRVANDYNTDMVREIHPDFKKINVQAIQQFQPSAEATVGLQNQNFLSIPVGDYEFYINVAGTQDTATGTGARGVTIDYVDANFDEQTTTIGLGGAAGVFATGIIGKAVTRMTVASVGSGLVNSGAIVLQDSTATHVFSRMETGDCVSHTGVYLIPRNKHLVVTDAQLSCVGYSGLLRIYEYDYGGIKTRGSIGDFRFSTVPVGQTFRLNGKVNEKKMIVVNVIPDVGTPTVNNNVCVNLNAVLCPAVNDF
jgi:hypothetical protein